MRFSILFLILAIATGCMTSNALQYESAATTNTYHLALVRKGMSEKRVLQIMHKPYSYETFEVDDDIYDVWFYVTRATGLDQTRMVPQNLTPLTFKNGILVGTGYNWYYYAMKEEAKEMEPQGVRPIKAASQKQEDEKFSKTLRAPQKQTAPEQKDPTKSGLQKALNEPKKKKKQKKLPPNVRIVSDSDALEHKELKVDTPINPCCKEKRKGEKRFLELTKGMSESQVFDAIGAAQRYETFEYEGSVYDVWFYDTVEPKTPVPPKVPQQMTPLVFKNAILVSMSEEAFFDLKIRVNEDPKAVSNSSSSQSFWKLKPYTPLAISKRQASSIQVGMDEEDVEKRLGKPLEKQALHTNEGVYYAWIYEMDSKRKKGKADHIFITFHNSKVAGISMDFYNRIREKAGKERIDCYTPETERMQQDESDQNFNYW